MDIKEIVTAHPIIAILRNIESALLLPYVESILEGGIGAVEIAVNSPDAFEQIRLLRENFGSGLLIGAGTVTSEDRMQNSLDAGASFFLTPSVSRELLLQFKKSGLPVLPGVLSPSEVSLCLKYDMNIMKLFPAGELPLSYIRSLKGPFETAEFVAVGGVNAGNMASFFHAGFLGVGIGSSLVPEDKLNARDWTYIRAHVKQLADMSRQRTSPPA